MRRLSLHPPSEVNPYTTHIHEHPSVLLPDQTGLPLRPPPRGRDLGAAGALAVIRQVLGDVDQWLRDQASDDGEHAVPTTLAVDGAAPVGDQAQNILFSRKGA